MKRIAGVGVVGLVFGLVALEAAAFDQEVPGHGHQMHHPQSAIETLPGHGAGVPALSGQDAFGAIQEVVRILEADPATDWSKVNLEGMP
jgi:hypothetical protein